MNSFPQLPMKSYSEARQDIRSGDILIASGNYMFSKIIQHATDSCWSHVALVMRLDDIDRVMVLESVEDKGVRTIPLSEYVNNFEGTGVGYKGRLAIARHKHFENLGKGEALKRMAQFAVDRFARPYDQEEIARITARIVGSAIGFKKGQIKRNDAFICSEYVFECLDRIGIKIDCVNPSFVAPSDFPKDVNVSLRFELGVKKRK